MIRVTAFCRVTIYMDDILSDVNSSPKGLTALTTTQASRPFLGRCHFYLMLAKTLVFTCVVIIKYWQWRPLLSLPMATTTVVANVAVIGFMIIFFLYNSLLLIYYFNKIFNILPPIHLKCHIYFWDTIHLSLLNCILLLIYKLKHSYVRFYLIRFNVKFININFL